LRGVFTCLIFTSLFKRYKDISKKLTTVSDSSLEEEVARINDMFKREMPYFLKLHKSVYFSVAD
jgi:hypothetical protein